MAHLLSHYLSKSPDSQWNTTSTMNYIPWNLYMRYVCLKFLYVFVFHSPKIGEVILSLDICVAPDFHLNLSLSLSPFFHLIYGAHQHCVKVPRYGIKMRNIATISPLRAYGGCVCVWCVRINSINIYWKFTNKQMNETTFIWKTRWLEEKESDNGGKTKRNNRKERFWFCYWFSQKYRHVSRVGFFLFISDLVFCCCYCSLSLCLNGKRVTRI